MARRGPTRAIESTGERSHSTTSITAAEAMKANGTIVAWALFRISWRYGWPVLTAIAAEIRMMFTHESAVAATTTRAVSAPTLSPLIGAISAPATSATIESTATLNEMRWNGRCSSSWIVAVATRSRIAPAAQPYRTIAATANTNVSETTPPPLSALIGTGNRSASVAAAGRAARLMSVRPLCAVVAKTYAAATSIARPARQTGRIRAVSRRGVTAWELTVRVLPGELVGDRLPRELSQQCGKEHHEGHESDQLWLPLQHPRVPPRRRQTAGFFRVAPSRVSPERGICPEYGLRSRNEARFGQGPPGPGEALRVPARERRDGHAEA